MHDYTKFLYKQGEIHIFSDVDDDEAAFEYTGNYIEGVKKKGAAPELGEILQMMT
ncbi:hypothetical protein [Chitinophaga vietnamensis]|uniref:hypothetical protein n=1 Tax=Chitinophaga vietnamensis TaxID=2593957 RepID=UPI001375510C|nr:hypothetical protein [Chitinophaga vietnamensis]